MKQATPKPNCRTSPRTVYDRQRRARDERIVRLSDRGAASRRLSLDRCRELLRSGGAGTADLDDAKLTELRDSLYTLADVAFDVYGHLAVLGREPRESRSEEYPEALAALGDDEREDIEERAAIVEHEGNLPRDEAEPQAVALVVTSREGWDEQETETGTPGRCLAQRRGDLHPCIDGGTDEESQS